jgi:hypothetical protein
MSENLIYVYDHLTGKEIVREMTDQEQTERNAQIAAYVAEQEAKTEAEVQAQAKRQALLERLGITADEARLLLS